MLIFALIITHEKSPRPPARDADSPVDGSAFDIPTDGSSVVIPIAAKPALNKPRAFVITLEQPGGIVKSKQEKVVALAKS